MEMLSVSMRQRERRRAGPPQVAGRAGSPLGGQRPRQAFSGRRSVGASNLRTALVLASIALVFFLGIIANHYLFVR